MIQIVGSVRYEWSEVHQNKFEYLTVDCQCYDRLILDHITYSIFEITWDCIRIHCRFQVIVIVCELVNTQFVEVQLIMTGRGRRQVQGWRPGPEEKQEVLKIMTKFHSHKGIVLKEGYWQYGSILKVDFTSGTFQTSHYWAEVAQPGQRDRWIQRLKMRVQWKFKVRGCVELSGKEGEGERERIPIQYDCFIQS